MERGFKYRIYPNESQRDQIARMFGCCRFVYNRALDVKKSAYAKTGKTVSWAELSRMLPAWKRDSKTSWLAQADSMALQQSIRDLDRAYKNFFRRVREGGKPGHLKKYERKLAREQRRLSRRKGARRGEKQSMRYLKQRKRVARIHAKIADARTDALHKVTTMLADENQVLCMENLNAKGMVRNHHLAKAVSDASFGEFARLLEYKCAERGRTLVKVGRFYPSSKTCSACGHRLDVLPLSVRSWDCPVCGAHHDRDVNAAANILTEGKRVLSNTEGTAGHAGTVAATVA
mgnify:CR=1 FL=1